jgi:mannosyltransferase
VAAFLLIAAWLLHMHPDEELSYRSTQGDIAFTLNYQMTLQDNQAPLWFVTFSAWRWAVGDAEYTSRVLGVLTVMLALAVSYRVGRRLFRPAWAAIVAPLLLIGNGFFFQYALDIRPYPMVMLCAALSTWAFTRWLDRPTPRRAVMYGLGVALMLYVHYLLIFLVAVQALYGLLAQKSRRELVAQGALAAAVALAVWLPWLPTFIHQVVGLRNVESQSGTARGVAGIGVSTLPTNPTTILDLINTATNGLPLLYAAVLLLGVALLRRERRYGLALVWALGAPLAYLGANLVAAVYAPRFVSHLTLGLALALAAALGKLPRRVGALGVAALVGANLFTFSGTLPVRVPYRDIYHQLSALGQPGDVFYMVKAGENDGFVHWQQSHYLAPDLQGGVTADPQAAQAARRVWFLTYDPFNPVVRAAFEALEPTHPVQQVIGQCPERGWCYLAQLMEAPPLAAPVRFGENVDFWGMDVDSVTRAQISTRLWWRVAQTPALDYSISLQMLDAQGALVAQADAPINHYGAQVVQTSALEPGKIYIDWRTLALPADLPPGTYTLALVVYQPWDGARLSLPDGSNSERVYTITIS